MILLLLFLEKSHSIKDSESQIYNIHFSLNNETLILFSRKIIYEYARDESFALPTILLDAKTLLTETITIAAIAANYPNITSLSINVFILGTKIRFFRLNHPKSIRFKKVLG